MCVRDMEGKIEKLSIIIIINTISNNTVLKNSLVVLYYRIHLTVDKTEIIIVIIINLFLKYYILQIVKNRTYPTNTFIKNVLFTCST